jgi:hypothetical protein
MRSIFLCMLLCLSVGMTKADDFYYYKDGRQNLQLQTKYLYVLCATASQDALESKVKSVAKVTKFHQDSYHQRLQKKYSNAPEYLIKRSELLCRIRND